MTEMHELPEITASICRIYVAFACLARICETSPKDHEMPNAANMHRAARRMYEKAPPEALRHLDALKRVMEIDTTVIDPMEVMKRAGLRDAPEFFTCPKCGRASYNSNDVKHLYCGACGWTD